MTQTLKSTDVLGPESVTGVSRVGRLQVTLEAANGLATTILAALIIGAVLGLCGYIVLAHDGELSGLRQAAFTTIVGLGSAAVGYIFGVRLKDG
jgi:predicted exporter